VRCWLCGVIRQRGVPIPDYLTWGLIPHDAETRPDNQTRNARAETIREKPMFRDAYRKRRAVVPIDAFQQKDAKGKLHTIKRVDGDPTGMPISSPFRSRR
jgi:putative SOS response-associated peptidase YedK